MDSLAALRTELIAGHPTHLRRLGGTGRQVLALHCSLAHGGAWRPLAEALAEAARTQPAPGGAAPGLIAPGLIAPDLPSHGLSADVATAADLHDLSTEIARALARRIGGGAPVDVIGHSFGGSVALRLALESPELVASLGLFEPVLFSAARAAAGPGTRLWLERQGEVDALLTRGERRAAAQSFNADWGHGAAFDSLAPRQQDSILSRLPLISAANAVLWDDAPGLMAPGRLEALQVPVLLAEGSLSPAVIAEVNAGLAARLPQASRLVVAGAGHMLPLSHPQALAAPLSAHLAAADRSRGADR